MRLLTNEHINTRPPAFIPQPYRPDKHQGDVRYFPHTSNTKINYILYEGIEYAQAKKMSFKKG